MTPEDLIDATERRGGVCQLPVVLVSDGSHATTDDGVATDDSSWRQGRGTFALHRADALDGLLAKAALPLAQKPGGDDGCRTHGGGEGR